MKSSPLSDLLWKNPIIQMQMNRRLRRKAVIIWGLITFIPCLFIFLNTYDAAHFVPYEGDPEQEAVASEQAFKACFIPMLIAQAIILLFVGIGSVAGQLGEEKETGLLDYHRMTPMTPAAKIIGYLFGLPCREYLLFFITVPFSIVATVFGKLPIGKVLLLYAILICLTITYHLTAMVAGMLAKRPRRASWFARVMVLILYIFLPAASQAGLHVFGHITFIPTLFSLFKSELKDSVMFKDEDFASIWETVPFYYWELPPALFSFVVLGLMMTMFSFILLRKWKKDTYHPFTKKFAIGVSFIVQILIVGSFVPILAKDKGLPNFHFISSDWTLAIVQYIHLLISLGICILLLHIITPIQHTLKNGLRRARKGNLKKIPFNWDAASSFPSCIVFLLTVVLSYGYLTYVGTEYMKVNQEVFTTSRIVLPLMLFTSIVLYVQSVRTIWQSAGFFGFLGLFWLVPLLCGMTISAFTADETPFIYLGIPNPITALYHTFSPPLEPANDREVFNRNISLCCHSVVAGFFIFRAWVFRKKIMDETEAEEINSSPPEINPASESAR